MFWASMIGNSLVGPYLLPSFLTSANYLISFKHVLPDLPCSQNARRNMWFQNDGKPLRYRRCVRTHLSVSFGQRWIQRSGPIASPPTHSPGLSSVNYFLWEVLKAVVYMQHLPSLKWIWLQKSSELLRLFKIIQVCSIGFTDPWSVGVTRASLAMVKTSNIFCNLFTFYLLHYL